MYDSGITRGWSWRWWWWYHEGHMYVCQHPCQHSLVSYVWQTTPPRGGTLYSCTLYSCTLYSCTLYSCTLYSVALGTLYSCTRYSCTLYSALGNHSPEEPLVARLLDKEQTQAPRVDQTPAWIGDRRASEDGRLRRPIVITTLPPAMCCCYWW